MFTAVVSLISYMTHHLFCKNIYELCIFFLAEVAYMYICIYIHVKKIGTYCDKQHIAQHIATKKYFNLFLNKFFILKIANLLII